MSVGALVHTVGCSWQELDWEQRGQDLVSLLYVAHSQSTHRAESIQHFKREHSISVCLHLFFLCFFSLSCRLLSTKWETEWIIRGDYFPLHKVPKIPSLARSHSLSLFCILHHSCNYDAVAVGWKAHISKVFKGRKEQHNFLASHKSTFQFIQWGIKRLWNWKITEFSQTKDDHGQFDST